MNPDTHSLAGAYAVNAVTDEERTSFEIHLDQCPDCRAEVAELRAAAATLAADVELAPPPALRASILSAVSQTRQLSPHGTADPTNLLTAHHAPGGPDGPGGPAGTDLRAPAGTTQPAASSAPTAEAPAPVDELAARRNRRLRPWFVAAVAAAVVTIGGLVWQPWQQPAAPQLTATEQVLRADDAQRLEQPMGASEVAIVRSPSKRQAVFVADSMPPAPSGRAYQLWFNVPGQGMVSAGMIPAAGETVAVLMRGDAAVAVGAGITLEPESGSEKPTTDPVALFSFT